jgi:long-chain fatty acid transport protein
MGIARLAVTVLLLLGLIVPGTLASGFENTGLGTYARGMGGAFRAVANDWTAAYYNPAGYAWVLDNQLGSALGLMHNRHELAPDYWLRDGFGNQYKTGVLNDVSLFNKHEILNNPSAGFIVRLPVWGETVFGLSAYQPFDYAISWNLYDIDGAGFRSYSDSTAGQLPSNQFLSNLDVVAFQLTAAREFSPERLALGIGLQIMRADLNWNDLVLRQNPRPGLVGQRPRDQIPEFVNNDGMGWGFGLTGGAMWKPTEKLNVAVTARLPFEITVDGTTAFKFVLPKNALLRDQVSLNSVDRLFLSGASVNLESDMEVKLKLPPSIAGGLAYEVTEKLTVALDAEYTLWSQYEGLDFTYTNFTGSSSIFVDSMIDFFTANPSHPSEWDNAGKIMVGVSYAVTDYLTLLGGVSDDQSPIRDTEERTPQLVDTGDKLGFNAGLVAHLDRWDVGFVTSYYDSQDLSVGLVDVNDDGIADSFPGEYQSATYETILSFNYRF